MCQERAKCDDTRAQCAAFARFLLRLAAPQATNDHRSGKTASLKLAGYRVLWLLHDQAKPTTDHWAIRRHAIGDRGRVLARSQDGGKSGGQTRCRHSGQCGIPTDSNFTALLIIATLLSRLRKRRARSHVCQPLNLLPILARVHRSYRLKFRLSYKSDIEELSQSPGILNSFRLGGCKRCSIKP